MPCPPRVFREQCWSMKRGPFVISLIPRGFMRKTSHSKENRRSQNALWPVKFNVILLIAAVAAAVMICPGRASLSAEPPTFNKQIAPIIYEYCAACHHEGGAGPFSLMT